MVGTLLKIPLKLVKLQIKLALVPGRVAFRIVRRLVSGESTSAERGGWSDGWTARGESAGAGADSGPSPNTLELEPGELMERLKSGDELVLIDVRQAQELADNGKIEGALHIPSQDLPHRISDLDKSLPTVVYCHVGSRSLDAAIFLHDQGFSDVRSLGGGIVGWQSDGGEVANA